MQISSNDRALLDGQRGTAAAMAMRIICEMARVSSAQKLIPIDSAHIDSCLLHGASGVEFAERLVAEQGRVTVPSSLNVGALDLLHPQRIRLPEPDRDLARRLMNAYVALGCVPSWTCAPYQVGFRPKAGRDIAWAESNAVVFANSVLGARTNRYGDFMDICCALTGRAPYCGLHVPENRYASIVVDTSALSDKIKQRSAFYPVLGTWLGTSAGSQIAVITGLPANVSEDQLKSLGASAASSGGVALFHIAGVTPEAATVEVALNNQPPKRVIDLTPEAIRATRDSLSSTAGEQLDLVAVGSPHFSLPEFQSLLQFLGGRPCKVPIYACTNRYVLKQLETLGLIDSLSSAGVELIVDTCVVVTRVFPQSGGVMMTNSGKFAHYSKSLTGYEVVFGSLEDCANSAVGGRIIRDEESWC